MAKAPVAKPKTKSDSVPRLRSRLGIDQQAKEYGKLYQKMEGDRNYIEEQLEVESIRQKLSPATRAKIKKET